MDHQVGWVGAAHQYPSASLYSGWLGHRVGADCPLLHHTQEPQEEHGELVHCAAPEERLPQAGSAGDGPVPCACWLTASSVQCR